PKTKHTGKPCLQRPWSSFSRTVGSLKRRTISNWSIPWCPAEKENMAPSPVKYAVISPVKNEARFIPQTIASMISQRLRPVIWLVVDDASTDHTARLVKDCERQHPWVRYLFHPGEANRKTGSAEIRAFDYGLRTLADLHF